MKKNLISVLILCTIFGNTLGKQKTNSFYVQMDLCFIALLTKSFKIKIPIISKSYLFTL